MTINAIELKKIKIATVMILSGIFVGKMSTTSDPIATLRSAGHAFSDGAITCSLLTSGSRAGNYIGGHITDPVNPIGAYTGALSGAMLGGQIAFSTTGSSIQEIITDYKNNRTRFDRIAQSVGCYCGSALGLAERYC